MGLVDGPDAEQRPGDRDLGLLGEGEQLVPRLRVEDAVAGEDHRPLGLGDLGRGQLQLPRVAVHVRAEARQPGDDLVLGRVLGARLLLEGVLGDVDVDRAGTAGPGDVEGLGDDARQLVRVAHQVVVLRHRQGDAVDVDLLEGVLADQRRRDVAGDRDHRDRVEERGPDAGDQVGRAGTRGAHADADAAGDAGVAVGGVRAALLVADEDVAELRVVAEDVVERQDDAARIAEEDVDALAEERLAEDVRPDAGPLEVAALVEHALAGALDRGRLGGPVAGHVAAPRAAGPGRSRRFALRHRHRIWSFRAASTGRIHRKTLASRRGSRRSSVVLRASGARSSVSLRSPAGSR